MLNNLHNTARQGNGSLRKKRSSLSVAQILRQSLFPNKFSS